MGQALTQFKIGQEVFFGEIQDTTTVFLPLEADRGSRLGFVRKDVAGGTIVNAEAYWRNSEGKWNKDDNGATGGFVDTDIVVILGSLEQMGKTLVIISDATLVQFGKLQDTKTVFIGETAEMRTDSGWVKTEAGEAKLYRQNTEGKWVKDYHDCTTHFFDGEYVIIIGRLAK
jgi:hypothetical protein